MGDGPDFGRIGADGPVPEASPPADDGIWLNEWASRELRIAPGDPVEVDYYRWQEQGQLTTETARFRLAGVVAIGGDVDATLAPEFPGISEARDIRDWDPPFPMDLRRIRPADEDYWHRYRATPKAFVTLARGQQLWSSRFGGLSSVRVAAPPDAAGEPASPPAIERPRSPRSQPACAAGSTRRPRASASCPCGREASRRRRARPISARTSSTSASS